MARFTVLTDSIIYDILRNTSGNRSIKRAKKLLRRIQRRKLYKFCGQTQPGTEQDCPEKEEKQKVVEQLSRISEGYLKNEHMFVDIVKIDFGMKQKNPVDNVVFYDKSEKTFKFRKEQVSQILPEKFHERYVRVYAKSPKHSESIKKYFKKWCKRRNYPKPHV